MFLFFFSSYSVQNIFISSYFVWNHTKPYKISVVKNCPILYLVCFCHVLSQEKKFILEEMDYLQDLLLVLLNLPKSKDSYKWNLSFPTMYYIIPPHLPEKLKTHQNVSFPWQSLSCTAFGLVLILVHISNTRHFTLFYDTLVSDNSSMKTIQPFLYFWLLKTLLAWPDLFLPLLQRIFFW